MNNSNTLKPVRSIWIWVISLFSLVFGLLTIKSGGSILFGDDAARVAAGNYVLFVLWFNFVAGFFYIVAGVGLWLRQHWAVWLALVIAAATAIAFVALGIHISSGAAYEFRTVVAITLRLVVWVAITMVAVQQYRR